MKKDPLKWLEAANLALKFVDSDTPAILRDDFEFIKLGSVQCMHDKMCEMQASCDDLEKNCDKFIKNYFQNYVSAKIIADDQRITTACLGMGSGKSFIAAIVANYYRLKG